MVVLTIISFIMCVDESQLTSKGEPLLVPNSASSNAPRSSWEKVRQREGDVREFAYGVACVYCFFACRYGEFSKACLTVCLSFMGGRLGLCSKREGGTPSAQIGLVSKCRFFLCLLVCMYVLDFATCMC